MTLASVDCPRQEPGREAGPERVVRASVRLASPNLLVLRVHEIDPPRRAGGVADTEDVFKSREVRPEPGGAQDPNGAVFFCQAPAERGA